MCKICRNEDISNTLTLDCNKCTTLVEIPEIKNSKIKQLSCCDCPNLKFINKIYGLKFIYCWKSYNIIGIKGDISLQKICYEGNDGKILKKLKYEPKLKNNYDCIYNINRKHKFTHSNENYLYDTSVNMLKINLYKLWKKYKFNRYINYLQQYIYSNPRMPYMKYYIQNNIDEEDKQNIKTRIGYINSNNVLIWFKVIKNTKELKTIEFYNYITENYNNLKINNM